jgi:hypothetical protein
MELLGQLVQKEQNYGRNYDYGKKIVWGHTPTNLFFFYIRVNMRLLVSFKPFGPFLMQLDKVLRLVNIAL